MIPRLSERSERKDGRGRSFRDLSSYLFVGELSKPDSGRVDWAETRNCHCTDPSQAWAEMAWTYQHTEELKIAAGVRRGGQKNEFPVWHVSLNWRDDANPSREEMMAAAEDLLKHFGLEAHQALVVAHADTDHKHLHLMVSLVNPHDGRTVDVSKSTKYRLSAWALAYEREHGEIQCEQREENWQTRANNKALYLLTAAAQSQDGAAPIILKTYGKSDSRPLWRLKRYGKARGLTMEHLAKLAEVHRETWKAQIDKERAAKVPGRSVEDPEIILARLTRHESVFMRKDMAKLVNAATRTPEEFAALMAKLEASPELIEAPRKGYFSTKTMVRTEAAMIRAVDNLAGGHRHGVGAAQKNADLSDEQNAALTHVLDSSGIACVVGYAGSGKSMMLGAARQQWEASGYRVRGFALSGIAAESLQGSSGIASTTLHSLQWQFKHGGLQLNSKDILVIDEAGMVGSQQMHDVLEAAQTAGAKVVLVGDPSQLQAIAAGGAFRAILDRVPSVAITTIRRQHEVWQQLATRDLAHGDVMVALSAYDNAGHLHAHATKETATAGLIAQWSKDLGQRTPALILAATRKDVAALNLEARQAMREARLLGQDFIMAAQEETIGQPVRDFRLRLAQGERVLFTKNSKDLGVKNGTLGVLEAAQGSRLLVRLDGTNRRVEFDISVYKNLAHGYALTIHKSQGVTVDRTHVLASGAMDRHSTYVALSRHRDSMTLHYGSSEVGSLGGLASRLGRERPKGTSLEYFADHEAALERSIIDRNITEALDYATKDQPGRPRFKPRDWGRDGPSMDR